MRYVYSVNCLDFLSSMFISTFVKPIIDSKSWFTRFPTGVYTSKKGYNSSWIRILCPPIGCRRVASTTGVISLLFFFLFCFVSVSFLPRTRQRGQLHLALSQAVNAMHLMYSLSSRSHDVIKVDSNIFRYHGIYFTVLSCIWILLATTSMLLLNLLKVELHSAILAPLKS